MLNQIIDLLSGNEDEVRIWKCKRVLVMSEHAHQMVEDILTNENINWNDFDFMEFQREFNNSMNHLEFYDIRDYYLSNFYNGELSYDEQVTFANAGFEYYSAMLGFYQIMQHKPSVEPNHYNHQIEQMQNGINVYTDLLEGIPEPEEPEQPTPPDPPIPPEPPVNPWDELLNGEFATAYNTFIEISLKCIFLINVFYQIRLDIISVNNRKEKI